MKPEEKNPEETNLVEPIKCGEKQYYDEVLKKCVDKPVPPDPTHPPQQ